MGLREATTAVSACVVILAMTAAAFGGNIIHVSTAGNDSNDGLSWATAKATVQAGLDAAVSGDQVWVATGTYGERITLKAAIGLYGGFAGTEADLSQRDRRANPTILDGKQAGSVVTATSEATAATCIDGFTIRNGAGTLSGVTRYGCGVYSSGGSPTISNNTIMGNTASSYYVYGCGIYCSGGAPTIQNNTIAGNIATGSYCQGGGIYCSSSSPTISNNAITGNSVSGDKTYGGGIFCSGGSPMILGNTISGNSVTGTYGGYGGGIYCSGGSLTIANTIVAFNSSGICSSGSGTVGLRYNCVYGNTTDNFLGVADPTGANGNISVDPRLLAVDYGDVHLVAGSPCIDAGDDAAVQSGWVDLDGESRIQAARVDIGADEFNGASPSTRPAPIVRVSPSGSDGNDGSSWETAKRTVQAGINAAASAGGGDVWVAAGAYTERVSLGIFFHVYGGFAGTETTRDQRDRLANVTILDGNAGGSVVSVSYGSEKSVIDGFTIRNGKASFGGGIYCNYSSPTISNNTITGNTALADGGGGGIACANASSPTIANNTISGNTALLNGGGIYSWSSSPAISNNRVTGNRVSGRDGYGYGGGILCMNSSSIISNNTITGNGVTARKGEGGGICCSGSPTIINNTVAENSASAGGGICCYPSSPTIANTIVAFNSSGICVLASGTPTLRSNCVHGNGVYNYAGVADPTGTDNNTSADPRFAGVAYGNVHIQPDSPCRDAGDDTEVRADRPDMDGQPRIQGGHVDIGADESDGTVWPAGPYLVVRVSPEGDNANDGSSWSLAKRTVQAGIAAAAAGGGEVWVRSGTYLERITLLPYAHVYGGFVGTENVREDRQWKTQPTILDGQKAGSVVTAQTGFRVSTIDGFIVRNAGNSSLGAVYCDCSSPMISNNTITENRATSGGGIICINSSSPAILNNTIAGNKAAFGGGIYCGASSSPTISNNTISGNGADSSAESGGGIYCSDSSPTITNNTITGNAGYRGGGIYSTSSSPTISNNTITGNRGVFGCGIYCHSGSPAISGNTIIANGAGDGAGIYCYAFSSPTISNTVVAFNSSGILWTGTGSGTLTLRNNCVFGNTSYDYSGLSAGTGDISADPLFVDRQAGDYHLLPGSPCIDAGDDAAVLPGSLDLDGGPRIQGAHVDIGADEFMPGDFNHDNRVDQTDFESFKACVSGPAIPCTDGCRDKDLDGDNDVDQTDFGLFQVALTE